MIFQLTEKASKASINLEGVRVSTAHRIGAETEKGLLLEVVHVVDGMDVKKIGYWLPKSLIKVENGTIEIPDWLWQKKIEAMDFVR
ncbi:MAG: hypothetical protein RBR39_11265 [Proteiniphilum sp.]|nr:hypothetical protein [Proteiniphilum sp.]